VLPLLRVAELVLEVVSEVVAVSPVALALVVALASAHWSRSVQRLAQAAASAR
jgi:hypothetical protein